MRRNMRNMFHRMQLTEQDVSSLRGMVVRLVEGPRTNGERSKNPHGGEPGSPAKPRQPHPKKEE
jgi:tRNA/rRNA methyltransferase